VALTADDLAVLLESFKSSEWTELALSLDGIRLELTKPDAQRAAAEATPAGEAASGEAATAEHTVRSPSIGIFRPTAQPGDAVEPDDVIAALEVLKLTMDVKAGARGTVREVHASDGDMVEHGQPLFTVDSGS
jgi:acetyl-CoA carboxylase biotin carboxyl carrier protein